MKIIEQIVYKKHHRFFMQFKIWLLKKDNKGERGMNVVTYFLFTALIIGHFDTLFAYHLPAATNLGTTNILDGGPKVDSPGYYLIQFMTNYHTNKFLDANGKLLNGVKSPTFDNVGIYTVFLYQSKLKFFGGAPGFYVVPPPLVFAYNSCNTLDIKSQEAGFSNPVVDLFFQWDMINYKGRPFFIHRLGSDLFLPFGTNKFPKKTVNPADIMTCLDSYWAATFYITEHWATSWRLFYLWCGKNKKTKITPGASFHMNYSMEYEVRNNYWIAINGYYLRQLHNSTLHGKEIPHSKERVLGVGPGVCFFLPGNYTFVGHVYFEKKARNRPQGINAVFDVIKYF